MFYCMLFIIVIMSFFLLYTNIKSMHVLDIHLILVSYFFSILAIILYLSRDTYYYNLLKQYFYLPEFLWRKFFFLSVNKFNLARLMNLFSLLIILFGMQFSLKFYLELPQGLERFLKIFSWINLIVQFLLYDPQLNIYYYYWLYPDFLSVKEYQVLLTRLYFCTRTLNIVQMLLSMFFLFISLWKAPKLKLFRFNYLYLSMGYSSLGVIYVFFISKVPAFYLNISKISDSYTYNTLYLNESSFFYRFLTLFLIIALLLLAYASWQITRLNHQVMKDELELYKEISASDTTSKIFCHYIKNEILAIQADLELLSISDENISLMEDLKQRCNTLYSRIDELHHNTRNGELHLKEYCIQNLIHTAVTPYRQKESEIHITLDFPSAPVMGFIDETYMIQALDNLICNAIDAVLKSPVNHRCLTIALSTSRDWITIQITDTGIGISSENMKNIFSPFYSTHPHSQHWGIGLSLTYKIIHAHEGKMDIRSKSGEGTTVTLLLPLIR